MSLFVGATPKWFSEFKWGDVWSGFKKDVAQVPSVIGKAVGDVIENSVKPALSGARSALTPTLIWSVVLIIVGLLLFSWFRKAAKI